jgi:amino acid adenylation domain-containing protein
MNKALHSERSYPLFAGLNRQRSIQARCFHPAGSFIEFRKDEIEQSVAARFARLAREYPDRLAVKTTTQELTYEELNRTANRVARVLIQERGTGAEPIALLLEHGASVIVAIFAVLKAGKFYLPLDPTYPQARSKTMLADSQAALVLTDAPNLPLARELAGSGHQVINLDELNPGLFPSDDIESPLSPDNPAYLIYTSGSTGRPKGVVQTHRNVLHDIRNYTNAFHICPEDRLVALHSYSFADTTRTTNAALLNGASLYPFDVGKEGLVPVAEWLTRHEITIYRSVPTTFRQFIRTLTGEERFPKLRLVYMAGEPVYPRDVDQYKRHFNDDCIFINGMGSTECLTHCWYFIDKKTAIDGYHVPIGHALEDIEILLLGDDGKEVGTQKVGEIGIKSRYLSPGYWRNPELTSAAFLSGPDHGNERVYRTGDLGLMLEDGCVVHMGRKDFQVKVRGHRIEVVEVETALLGLDNIKEAIVMVRETQSGDPRLVAYLVATQAPASKPSALRDELAKKLPDYMIPSAFVFLDALPLLPNGKLDRRALPAPAAARPDLETFFVAPGSPTEILLGQIWAETLGLERVGVHDNFFELGGHSLLATQVISRLRDAFRFELPLRMLFEHPTIASLAEQIDVLSWAGKRDEGSIRGGQGTREEIKF